jgi:hypothetical protein
MTSCNTDRKFRDALTAKGCNMNSIRAQSELAFRKMDKRMKIPAGYFTTDIIENDSLILIQRTLTNGDIRNKGGMDVVISKATCKVTKLLVYQ